MKKIVLGLTLMLGVCTLFMGGTALAARSGGNVCDSSPSSDDQRLFPHGFICGTASTATGPTYNAGWDSSTPNNGTHITEGSSVTVRGGYSQSAAPQGPVLVWITVDGSPTATSKSNISLPYGGSKDLACPNHSGNTVNNPGPVYGYRDLPTDAAGTYDDPAYDNQNRNEQSPYAYDRVANKGYIDCGTQGSMVYWTNASSGRSSYGLTLNIPDDTGGSEVCFRLNISVWISGDNKWFPDSTTSQAAVQQHVAASHIAKQSDRYCYQIDNGTHPNSYTASFDATCTQAFGRLTQYNNAGTPTNANVAYVLQHWNPATNAWENITAARSSVGRNWSTQDSPATSFNGDAYFGNGGDAAFRLVSLQFGILPNPATQPGGYIKGGLDCHDDPTVVDFSPTCHSVYLNAFYDPDSWNGPRGAVNAYERSNGSRGWTDIPQGTPSGATIEYNQPPDQQNSGFDVYVSAYNVVPSGYGGGIDYGNVVTQGKTIGPCYAATCSLQAIAPSTGLPINKVEAGQQFTLRATINNTGDGDNNTLYSSLGGNALSITPGQYQPNSTGNGADNAKFGFGSVQNVGTDVGLGGSKTIEFNLTAPNEMNSYTLDAYPDFFGRFSIQPSPGDPYVTTATHCSVTVTMYRHFTLTPHAALPGFNSEDPATLSYHPWVTDDEHVNDSGTGAIGGIPTSVAWSLYKLNQATGTPLNTFNSGGDPTTRILTNTEYGAASAQPDHRRDYGTKGAFVNDTPYEAGDQYCADTTVNPATGYIGPGDEIPISSPATDHQCPHVTNKPFFKVYGGNISAGGQFSQVYDSAGNPSSTGCVTPTDEGVIGGYVNTSSATYTFGSSTQLTAQAMRQIMGVESGKTTYNSAPSYRRAIANNTNIGGGDANYGVNLGGNLNNTAGSASCMTTAEPDDPSKTPTYGIADGSINANIPASAGSKVQFTHNNTPLTLNADSLVDRDVSIFTDGDVIIAGNIYYSNGVWSRGSVPSLVIRAKGNIYIDKSVGNVDGMFISQKQNGKISTCSTGLGAAVHLVPQGGTFYADCSKQLTIHGSFVADYVNLMRTYGTMRNEKPSSIDTVTVTGSGYSSCTSELPAIYPCANSSTGVYSYVNYDATYNLINKAVSNYDITLNYSNNNGSKGYAGWPPPSSGNYKYSVDVYVNGVKQISDWRLKASATTESLTRSLGAVPANATIRISWTNNNWIDNSGNEDTVAPIDTAYDPNLQINSFTLDNTTTAVPPSGLSCSNNGGATFNRVVSGSAVASGPTPAAPYTCASEVFDFSPEQYMTNPAITKKNKGAPTWDSITSLPPIL